MSGEPPGEQAVVQLRLVRQKQQCNEDKQATATHGAGGNSLGGTCDATAWNAQAG